MLKFHFRVQDINSQYENNNNGKLDHGVYNGSEESPDEKNKRSKKKKDMSDKSELSDHALSLENW